MKRYKSTRKKIKTKLGMKKIYLGKYGKYFIKVKNRYYPLYPK